MSAPTEIDRRFRRNLRGEVLRLLNHQHHAYISREEVERIGKDPGLSPGEATYEFLSLRGMIWEGTPSRAEDSQHSWDIVHFDVPWFQRIGDVPTGWDC